MDSCVALLILQLHSRLFDLFVFDFFVIPVQHHLYVLSVITLEIILVRILWLNAQRCLAYIEFVKLVIPVIELAASALIVCYRVISTGPIDKFL